jgi:hypothetical protein
LKTYSVTLTTNGTDTTAYTKLTLVGGSNVPSANTALGDQTVRLTASINASGGTGTLRFVLRSDTRVRAYKDVVLTVTSVRTGPAGSSGDYVCTLSSDFLDTSGLSEGYDWYVGLPSAMGGSATSITLDYTPMRAI